MVTKMVDTVPGGFSNPSARYWICHSRPTGGIDLHVDSYKTARKEQKKLSKKILALLFAATVIAAFFGDTTVAEAQFVTDGLVGRWTFDAIVQGKVKDVFGSNDGDIKGNPKLVEGQIRSAMRFTGGERIQI